MHYLLTAYYILTTHYILHKRCQLQAVHWGNLLKTLAQTIMGAEQYSSAMNNMVYLQ